MHKDDFAGLKEGLRQVAAHQRGEDVPGIRVHIPPEIDTKAIRERLGLSQDAFADRFGFPVATLRGWEQGRRVPDPVVRAYLKVISAEPAVVERVLERA